MSGAYDEALLRFAGTGPFYGTFGQTGFANHGPMVVEVLDRLGRGPDIAHWVDRYAPLLRERPAEQQGIAAENWQLALGDWRRAGDWLAFFERGIAAEGWRATVRRWLPRLMRGPDVLGHGPIRLFHVVRALDDQETEPRVGEVGDALAYWAMAYDPSFAIDVHIDDGDHVARLDDVMLESAWAYLARPDVRPIVLTHAVTAPRAIRELLEWLPIESRRLATEVALSLSRQIRAPYVAPRPPLDGGQPAREMLIEQCVVSGDDHAIKLTEACLRQYERQPEAVYLAVADDIARRLRL